MYYTVMLHTTTEGYPLVEPYALTLVLDETSVELPLEELIDSELHTFKKNQPQGYLEDFALYLLSKVKGELIVKIVNDPFTFISVDGSIYLKRDLYTDSYQTDTGLLGKWQGKDYE